MSLTRTRSLWTSAFTSFTLAIFVWCLPAASFAQTSASLAVAPRLTQKIDETQTVTLKGTMHHLATAANDRGAVEAGFALERVQVMLKRSPAQESALQQLLQQMHQPGSASYHKWLTPAQFGEQFGPSDADIATISSWLGAHGFTVTKVTPGKQALEFSGTAGQFKKTFHTEIHKFQVNGQTHTANVSDPSIPAALAPVFGGFASLNNFPVKSNARALGTAKYDLSTHKATPNWTEGDTSLGPLLLLAPSDFAVQYDVNPLYTAGVTGTGVTIGIINESNIDLGLANQYRTLFGLPANPPKVIIDGNDPGIDGVNNPDGPNYASGEAYLDVEQAGSVAPGATIDLIIAADTALSSGLDLAIARAVYGNVAPILSLSFGSCENPSTAAFASTFWEQAAAQGQTVLVSTGDSGSAGCDNDNAQDYAVNGQMVNGLASTPYNVAVGGTDMYFSDYATGEADKFSGAAKYWSFTASPTTPAVSLQSKAPEQPFNSSQYGLDYIPNLDSPSGPGGSSIFAAGGGASNCAVTSGATCVGNPKPAFQVGTGPSDGVRDLPDVSMFGALYSNLVITPICASDGDCQPAASGGVVQVTSVGGTSVSAPSFAGIMALVNQKYGPQGEADYVLYPLAKQFPTAFNDVVNGTNSVPCNITTANGVAPFDCIAVANGLTVTDITYGQATEGEIGSGTTPEYNAGVGYDLASGLGSVDANNLVTNWGSVTFTASSVTLTPSATSFVHGTPITIAGTVTPATAGGNVALDTTSSIVLNPADAANTAFPVTGGTYGGSVDFLPGGTYEIYGVYGGDGTNGASSSAKTSITVTAEASFTSLVPLNSVTAATGSVTPAFANGATLPYGTQIVLEAEPGASSGNTTTTPTGTVTFLNGTTVIGTAQVNVFGEAALNYAPVPSTTAYSITAQYSGDASYSASTSGTPLTFTVTAITPSLSLVSSTQTSATITAVSGKSALSVSVEGKANLALLQQYGIAFNTPAVAPTGVVTVTGLPSGPLTFPALSSVIDPNDYFIEGVATIVLPSEAPGSYPVTVSYPGDANYSASTYTTSVTITSSSLIATTTTATALAPSTSASTAEQVTYTVTASSGNATPTGSVELLVSGLSFGAVTLPASTTGTSVSGTIQFDGLAGANEIVLQYSGSATDAPSSTVVNIENGGAPTFGLSSNGSIGLISGVVGTGTSTISLNPFNGFSGSVALSCAVTPSSSSAPTCTVTTPVSLSGTASSSATVTVTSSATTAAGNYTVTVTGTSGALVQTISVPVTVGSISLTSSGSISISSPGGSGTSTITVSGLTSAITAADVSLSCAVTGSTSTDAPTCSLSTLTAGTSSASATSTLTVSTTASAELRFPQLRMLPLGGGIAAAALLFFLVPMKRRRLSTLLGLVLLIAAIGMSAGCGGGSSSSNSNPGTPAGTYTVTISGTASGGPISPTTVTVTVQ